jgi:hypothetical protein
MMTAANPRVCGCAPMQDKDGTGELPPGWMSPTMMLTGPFS